ncbi:MAG: DUF6159 family protein [Actinomycetota bacterium]|nr:DUF6159 family protein [Actinomycetota bacterium]
MQGGRISRGWALAKQSFAVLRADRSLLLFPVIAMPAALAAAAIVMGPGVALYAADRQEAFLIAFGALTLYALTFVTVFFNTALAAAAARSLDGADTTVGEGLAAARSRLGVIAAWALVQTVVGIAISAIQEAAGDSIVGRILAGLVNFAWSAATFFVVPVIALEGVGPRDAFKRSVSLLRERWGEGVVGTASVSGVVFLIALLPIAALGVPGVMLLSGGGTDVVGGILLGLAAVVLVLAMLVGGTANAIFRVALYRYATDGVAAAGFDPTQLESAFAPKRRRRI